MALNSRMQAIIDNLNSDINEQDLNRDSILKRLEETKTKINRFYDLKADEFNSKEYTEMTLDSNGNEIENKISVSLNQDDDNETKRLKLEQGYNKVDTANSAKYSFDKERYEQRKQEYEEKIKSNPKLASNAKFRAPKEPTTLNSNFQKSLQNAVKENEQKQISLKKEAETVLKIKSKLIENTQKIAERMKAEMDNITSKKAEVEKEVEDVKEKINEENENYNKIKENLDNIKEEIENKKAEAEKYNEDWRNKLQEVQEKRKELQAAIDAGKPKEEIEKLEEEIKKLGDKCVEIGDLSEECLKASSDLEKEYTKKEANELTNAMNNLTSLNSLKIAKEDELKSIPDNAMYEEFFKELGNIKSGLEVSLENDIQTFTEKFAEVEIDMTEETISKSENIEEVANEEKNTKADKSESKSNASSVVSNEIDEEELEENGLLDITDRKSSNEIANKFMNASLDEQEKFLKYYGYEDLAKSAEHLGPFARAKLAKCLEEHFNNNIPIPIDFLQAVTSVSDTNIDYRKFFDKNNNPLMFNKLDVDTLRDVQQVISDFNANKANMSKDEIEFFDKNFMSFIKNGALLQNVKTGKIRGFLQGLGTKSTVRKNILNAMSSYTRENANNISKKENVSNKLRDRLGLQIKDPSTSIEETRLNRKVRSKEELNR